MDMNEVKRRLGEVERYCADGDDEMAHVTEKDLLRNLVIHVSLAGDARLKEMAKEALKSEDIEFSRWFA